MVIQAFFLTGLARAVQLNTAFTVSDWKNHMVRDICGENTWCFLLNRSFSERGVKHSREPGKRGRKRLREGRNDTSIEREMTMIPWGNRLTIFFIDKQWEMHYYLCKQRRRASFHCSPFRSTKIVTILLLYVYVPSKGELCRKITAYYPNHIDSPIPFILSG